MAFATEAALDLEMFNIPPIDTTDNAVTTVIEANKAMPVRARVPLLVRFANQPSRCFSSRLESTMVETTPSKADSQSRLNQDNLTDRLGLCQVHRTHAIRILTSLHL